MSDFDFDQAMALHQAGRYAEAADRYRQLLKRRPGTPDLLHLFGLALAQSGRLQDGIKQVELAIRRGGAHPIFLANLARLRAEAGDGAGAIDALTQLLAQTADDDEARKLRADLALKHDRAELAVADLRHLLARRANDHGLWNDFGCAINQSSAPHGASKAFQTAMALDPAFGAALSNLGGTMQDGLAWSARAFHLSPNDPSLAFNLGVALNQRDQYADAADYYRLAARFMPNDGRIWNNLATAVQTLGLHEQALDAFRRALALDPALIRVWSNLGNACRDGGEPRAAESAYRRALTLDPDFAEARSSLIFCLNGDGAIENDALGRETLAYETAHAARLRAAWLVDPTPRAPNRPLRIGYVSPDFRSHSCAWFLEPLFAAHDRQEVTIHAYAELRRPDTVTERFKALADHWVETKGVDDAALARRIRDDGIDVLVDLAGHTGGNRLLTFARKPAPVQVSWLGYNGATGLAAMDWRLTDRWMAPTDSSEIFAERLWRLDRAVHVYRPPPDAPAVTLREGVIVFGSFNNLSKLSPETVALWGAVLRAVPDSRLLIKTRQLADLPVRARVTGLFDMEGVAADRLSFAPWTRSTTEHLALYGEIDIALDPFPYHGTTTTCEALWMGVPVISLQGSRLIARVGGSLLNAVGLADCAVTSTADFVGQAVALASDRVRLAALRQDLRARMAASPLRDEQGFARAVEQAFTAMAMGQPPP